MKNEEFIDEEMDYIEEETEVDIEVETTDGKTEENTVQEKKRRTLSPSLAD